ncbi:MAG: YdcF family protein [Gammaproteobacteria bacterium]|nr:YdcF family protein [Gammaproteobacteria bacterium]
MTFGYFLKKALGWLLTPIGFFCFCLLCFVVFRRRRPKLGKSMLTVGIVSILLLGFEPVSYSLLSSLEKAEPHFSLEQHQPDLVFVFGARSDSVVGIRSAHHLTAIALTRLEHGVALVKRYPEAKLVFAAAVTLGDSVPQSKIMRDAAIELGVQAERISTLGASYDTLDELNQLKLLGEGSEVALVSSASHMRRIMMMARYSGLNGLPAPTDFRARPVNIPALSAYNLDHSRMAMHEWVGMAWFWLKSAIF